ncbi:MAG: acetate--CoA ligase family protein [Rhodospirillales bacterium]|nr:acetate--CoA ligase family protein [Rhodospirillales bacterium]
MSEHYLRPLMDPTSIALVGASGREGAFGHSTLLNLDNTAIGPPVYPVNPGYDEIMGLPCYASLASIPGGVEHAVLSVANTRVEAALIDAAENGVKSVTMFGSAYLEGDTDTPRLKDRLQAIAREAGLLVCGANCMGFVNYLSGVRATWMNIAPDAWFEPGNITLISHSGTCFLSLQFIDPRHRHNLCISAGQELTVTAADYMDYALEQESTRAIALFLEMVRDPEAFRAVLDKAVQKDIPVVAIKVGRTEKSAELARSHSGALAGDDAAYEALFDHYGVLRVENWNDLAATSRLLSHHKRIASGNLAGIMDSGGARGMLIDLADKMGVPLADIGSQTVEKLTGLLEYGLEPVNPTDIWGTGLDWENVFEGCMQALADDEDSAITGMFSDLNFTDDITGGLLDIAEKVDANTDKPVFFCQHWSRAINPIAIRQGVNSSVILIDGTETFLTAFKLAMQRRDRRDDTAQDMIAAPDADVVARWQARLDQSAPLDENDGLDLLSDFGIAVPERRIVTTEDEAAAAGDAIGYPLVLKTAEAGILHKSDVGGVKIGIADEAALRAAWSDMAGRLGPRALVAAMVPTGVELAAGLVIDPQFGPLVMVAVGGILIELMKDRRFLLPPAGRTSARRALDGLACRPMLDGIRGMPAADIDAVCDTIARLSVLAVCLGDRLAELDLNPLIAGPDGCIAVDALVVPASRAG